MNPAVLVLDFGSQYTRLIARRIRENRVYSEIVRYDISADEIKKKNAVGLVLSGGPDSIYRKGSPCCSEEIFGLGIPVLGICYGMQLMTHLLGGTVEKSDRREYGRTRMKIIRSLPLLEGLDSDQMVWMSHRDRVARVPEGFEVAAETEAGVNACIGDPERHFYGIQFHPEVNHTPKGMEMLNNFLYGACRAEGSWNMAALMEEKIENIKETAGDGGIICGLSGGVDSSVAAVLAHKAVGDKLQCIFVDTGLLRYREAEQVMNAYTEGIHLNVKKVDASERFFKALNKVEDPERKRRIIGELFIDVFQEEAERIAGARFLVQGTLYPDVIESAGVQGPAATIKTHHNVGGLPETLKMKLIEPLRDLFKDEVRKLGAELGIPDGFVWRHPFPGPGLAVRILGAVTPERVSILQKADNIFIEEIKSAGLYRKIAQAFAVLLPVKSVGVMGDGRTYENVLALRAVETKDFMTADWSRIPYDVLDRAGTRIINEVKGINRVVYDISTKPPSTIEWE